MHAGGVCKLAGRADLANIAERPDVMQRVTGLLECLRGAAQGTTPQAQKALFGVVGGVMEPLLVLQRVYRQHEPTVCLLLKLAADIVDAHVSYLSVRLPPKHVLVIGVGVRGGAGWDEWVGLGWVGWEGRGVEELG